MLVEGLEIVSKLFGIESFKKNDFRLIDKPLLSCRQFEFGVRDNWKYVMMEYTTTFSYQVETCKVGLKFDPDAVMDERLKDYEIDGLRVVDGSFMSKIVKGNTNAATIMIAEKASGMIKEVIWGCWIYIMK